MLPHTAVASGARPSPARPRAHGLLIIYTDRQTGKVYERICHRTATMLEWQKALYIASLVCAQDRDCTRAVVDLDRLYQVSR
ncbi:MAG: hypothetical protein K6U89_20380 [Chloroflexi bacterium]|nr:hypothetical protein [Chloroflexota bacterium]